MSPPTARPGSALARLAPLLAMALAGAAGLGAAGLGVSPVEAAPGAPPVMVGLPGPGTQAAPAGVDVAAVNAGCASCHVEIAAEWATSMHRQAWVDPVFQEAYDIEPLAFCRGCHAPEADPATVPTAAAQQVGVACTTCHVQETSGGGRVVVGAHGASPSSPHPVLADARLGTTDACGSCHQFDFPRLPGAAMQDTLEEHASSRFAAVPCQGCHMPEKKAAGGRTWRSHAFAVIADPAMVRSAATARAERASPRAIRVTIEPRGAGHAFPTGDMFRRLEVRAVAVDPASGAIIARAEPVHLGRTFGDRLQGAHSFAMERIELEDSRVPAPGAGPGRVVEVRFAVPVRGAAIRWQLAYQRMPTAMAGSFGVEQALDEIIVSEGVVAPVAPVKSAAAAPREETGR